MREYDVNEPVEIREERVEMRMEGAPRGYDREPELRMKEEYKPKKQELLKEYEIRLRFLSVGCVVGVGCKEIPFRSVKEAMDCVNEYVENPYEVGKKWHSIFDGEE
jgi:hypothetical protein